MLGALVVSLGLDAAEFVSGMSKSEQQAKKFASTLDRSIAVGIIKAEVALRTLGAAARTTFDAFQSLTMDAAAFKDLEETTGASAQSLASLAVGAATAGVPMENVAGSVNKLTKSLVGVDDESKAAGAALKSLGLNIAEFKQLDPAAQYEAVGKAINKFADDGTSGAAKVAAAMALFGKSGAEQLKVFKALEEQGGAQIILTQRQIELSDAYADAQAKATKELQLYAQAAASEAIPAIADMQKVLVDLGKEFLGVDRASGQLAANNSIKKFSEDGIRMLADLVDKLDLVARAFVTTGNLIGTAAGTAVLLAMGKFKEAFQAGQEFSRQTQAMFADRPKLVDRLDAQRARSKVDTAVAVAEASPLDARDARAMASKSARPTLKFDGVPDKSGANDAAREQKRIMDGQIKAIRAFADEQKEAFDFANRFVRSSYEDGLVTLQQTFESERQIRAISLQSTIAALDAEVRVLEQHASKAAKPEVRIEAENKIAEAVAKRSQAVRQAQQEGVLAAAEEGRAIATLRNRYDDLRATIMEMSGNVAGASALRINQQVEDARKLLAQSGQDQGQAATLKQLLTDTERLRQAQAAYNGLLERSQLAEESILLTAREYGATEWETLRAVGVERNKALDQMAGMVAEAQELAAVLGTDEARRYAEGLAVAFQRARAEADPLLQKVRSIGAEIGDSIAGGLEEAIVQGGSFRDVLKGIEKDLIAIGTRELITKPLGDALTNIIGGNGQASGGGGLLGKILGSFGGLFAAGGDLPAGKWGIAGENGRPELIRGPAHVVPHNRSMAMLSRMAGQSRGGDRGNTFNATFVLPPGGYSRATQQQIAADAARSVAAANARLN